MSGIHSFAPGDVLIFQLEAGYALLRVLAVEERAGDEIWHLTAYRDLFLDPEMADAAIQNPQGLTVELPHVALTTRAFESTQVARMGNIPLTEEESDRVEQWRRDGDEEISDRSIRLVLGWR